MSGQEGELGKSTAWGVRLDIYRPSRKGVKMRADAPACEPLPLLRVIQVGELEADVTTVHLFQVRIVVTECFHSWRDMEGGDTVGVQRRIHPRGGGQVGDGIQLLTGPAARERPTATQANHNKLQTQVIQVLSDERTWWVGDPEGRELHDSGRSAGMLDPMPLPPSVVPPAPDPLPEIRPHTEIKTE